MSEWPLEDMHTWVGDDILLAGDTEIDAIALHLAYRLRNMPKVDPEKSYVIRIRIDEV